MPSFRRVSFSDRNHYSRLPHDDELYVMKAFARHADNCDSCYDPYKAYKDGSTLCPQGHQRALDVAQYVYNRGGQSFSQVDRERNQRVQIEIPANCEAVRLLLKAMDRGLRLMRKAAPPPTIYDRNYYVPARLSVPDNHRSMPATRASASTASKSSSSKASISEIPIAPRQSRPKSRARSPSASSVSSTGSTGARNSRPHFVRSRSKDGKRSHSPIFVRTSRSAPQASNSKKEARPAPSVSHSRQSSTSSDSSRSSSIFSRSSSRNSSVSSDSSIHERPVTSAATSAPPAKTKVTFRNPEYQETAYQTIAPKNAPSPPISPVRSRSRYSK